MYWGMGFTLGIIWLALLLVLGVSTWRNGHMVLFWLGIIFPVLWVFGAAMRPRLQAEGGA